MASPGRGGLESAFAALSSELALRCEVTALVPDGAACLDDLSHRVTRGPALPRGSRRNPLTLLGLRRLIQAAHPDLVHSHAAKAAEMVHWATLDLRVPHVATKHNTRPRRIFGRVEHVTAVSEVVARSIRRHGPVAVVHNGIAPHPVPSAERPDVFTMISVGRLDANKGFENLVRQVATLPFPCRLEIVGEGRLREELAELIDRLEAHDRVVLLGHRDDVPELLARAHVQVVASRSEGFGLTLVEGLHYAHLVVSTGVGIAPEILPDELISAPGALASTLNRVHDDYDALRARFRARAVAERGRFTLAASADAYLEVYERARAAARRRR